MPGSKLINYEPSLTIAVDEDADTGSSQYGNSHECIPGADGRVC